MCRSNVTHEHLDFHGSFENYRAAKALLFKMIGESFRKPGILKIAVINLDDASAPLLENFVDDFRYMVQTEEDGVLTYTFHPQVVGRGHRMLMLEHLIEELKELGAEFARMDAAADRFLQVLPA